MENIDDLSRQLAIILKVFKEKQDTIVEEMKNKTPEEREQVINAINIIREEVIKLQSITYHRMKEGFVRLSKEEKVYYLGTFPSDQLRNLFGKSLSLEDYEICEGVKIVLEERGEEL